MLSDLSMNIRLIDNANSKAALQIFLSGREKFPKFAKTLVDHVMVLYRVKVSHPCIALQHREILVDMFSNLIQKTTFDSNPQLIFNWATIKNKSNIILYDRSSEVSSLSCIHK